MLKYIVLFSVLSILGCMGSKGINKDQEEIIFQIVDEGSYSGFNREEQLWIKNNDEWEACWNQLHKNTIPIPEVPTIDFEKNHVMACFMGEKGKGGYNISVDQVEKRKDTLHVEITYNIPGNNCITTMALSQPYIIISFPAQRIQDVACSITEKKTKCG